MTGEICILSVFRSSVRTEIKKFIESAIREGFLGTNDEFLVNAPFPLADTVNLADRDIHGSGKLGKVFIPAECHIKDSCLDEHSSRPVTNRLPVGTLY